MPAVAIKSCPRCERARGRDNWGCSLGYSAVGLVKLTRGEDERSKVSNGKWYQVGRAAGIFTHCELTFEVLLHSEIKHSTTVSAHI